MGYISIFCLFVFSLFELAPRLGRARVKWNARFVITVRVIALVGLAMSSLLVERENSRIKNSSRESGTLEPTSGTSSSDGVPHIVINNLDIAVHTPQGVILSDRGRPLLAVEQIEGKLVASLQVYGSSGELIAKMVGNNWQVNKSRLFQVNYSANAVEVIDNSDVVVLQVINLGDCLYIAAIVPSSDGYYYSLGGIPNTATEFAPIVSNWRVGGRPTVELRPMFRYPSDEHLGEFAAGHNLIAQVRSGQLGRVEAALTMPIPLDNRFNGEDNKNYDGVALFFGDFGPNPNRVPRLETDFWPKSEIMTAIADEFTNGGVAYWPNSDVPRNATTRADIEKALSQGPLPFAISVRASHFPEVSQVGVLAYLARTNRYYLSVAIADTLRGDIPTTFVMAAEGIERRDLGALIQRQYPENLCSPDVLAMIAPNGEVDYVVLTFLDGTGALIMQQRTVEFVDGKTFSSLSCVGRCTSFMYPQITRSTTAKVATDPSKAGR